GPGSDRPGWRRTLAGAVALGPSNAARRHPATARRPRARGGLSGRGGALAVARVANVPSARPLPATPARRFTLGDWSVPMLALPAAGFLVALFIYPFLYGLDLSLRPDGSGLSLANYLAF